MVDVYPLIDASPVKRFFVEMLTRDIQVEDAILDLLDNCIDGILRTRPEAGVQATPYTGFWAKITVNGTTFEIEDNCGGIPWSEHEKAFRMGRPRNSQPIGSILTVGAYGIGMKRALFKIGQSSLVLTQNGEQNYQVLITPDWITDETDWMLKVEPNPNPMQQDGTHLIVQDLYQDIQERFSAGDFVAELIKKIASHYAFIIQKGFQIEVNGQEVTPSPIVVRYAIEQTGDTSVRPYMFKSDIDGVSVFLVVGLREPIPDYDLITDEETEAKYSSDYAGWTIICNDRVVLYCDRSELTGWGLFGVPRYHTQFIAISGVVEFRGDPTMLPTTTTKRGLKFESSLYQHVLARMIEGTKVFTSFTYKWKGLEREAATLVDTVRALPYSELKSAVENSDLPFQPTHTGLVGERFRPHLPMPARESNDARVSFSRSRDEVTRLAELLLPNYEDLKEKDIPRQVGIASFEYTYKQFVNKP